MRVAQERENMAKLTLNDVTNINSLTVINENFDKIEQALQNQVLYRDNPDGEPNSLSDNLDMNGRDILNVNSISALSGRFATVTEVEAIRDQVTLDKIATNASKVIAEASATVAEAAATSTTSLYDLFDDRFLGAKSFEPVTDNDGNSLVAGSMYFALQISPSRMRIYSGIAWQDVGSFTSSNVNTIDASLYPSQTEAEQASNSLKVMTPLRVGQQITYRFNSPTFTGVVTAPQYKIDNQFYLTLSGTNPAIAFDPNDFISYDRVNNYFNFYANGVNVLYVGPADGPARITDATTANGLIRKSQLDSLESSVHYPGDTKNSYRTTDHGRWLLLTGDIRSIGNAASGATARANVDVLNLYAELWSNIDPLVTTIQDSSGASTTRGANYTADFNALKRIILPNHSGLVTKGHHGGNGTFTTNTTRAFGSYEQDSILNHNHFFGLHIEGGSAPGPRGVIAASDRGGDNGGTSNTDGSNNYGQNVGFYTSYVSNPAGRVSGENTVRTRSQNVFIYY